MTKNSEDTTGLRRPRSVYPVVHVPNITLGREDVIHLHQIVQKRSEGHYVTFPAYFIALLPACPSQRMGHFYVNPDSVPLPTMYEMIIPICGESMKVHGSASRFMAPNALGFILTNDSGPFKYIARSA